MEKQIKNYIYPDLKANPDQVDRYTISGTSSSKIIDDLAVHTANIFNTQVAVISFVDQYNHWPKRGQPAYKVPDLCTDTNVCAVAFINEIEDYIEVPFEEFIGRPELLTNALIVGEFGMRFYVSVPIIDDAGVQIGTVCILDRNRREFLPSEREKLKTIADLVKIQMDKRAARKAKDLVS